MEGMHMEAEEETVNLTLRVPRALRDRLAVEAKAERRSINAQVTVILEHWASESDDK
jgi:hypothetical protein